MRWWGAVAGLMLVLVVAVVIVRHQPARPSVSSAVKQGAAGCREARADFASERSGDWISLRATVDRLLPDSYGRYRHQRFVVRCGSGQTVLVVNDVSIGQRAPVELGGQVTVRGQYVWNRQGGLVHFTHHGEAGGPGGWILWKGHLFSAGRAEWTKLRTKTWIRLS